MFHLPLSQQGLPYPDPIHPIIVHFVIAMVFFSFICDVLGYFTHRPRMFEVSFWNLIVAAISIFLAVMFGQFEAGLAQPQAIAQSTLSLHTIMGWSLAAFLVAITAWRFVMRHQNPLKVSPIYLGFTTLLSCLVFFQMMLGSQLVWVYGLHVEPVVEATKQGLLKLMVLLMNLPGLKLGANGLPYPIPIHPQLVHLTLGLVIIAILFDIAGTLFPLGKPIFKFLALPAIRAGFYEVGWYNLVGAAIITFFTVAAGFFELMLATPPINQVSNWGLDAKSTLLLHGLGGILLLAAIVGMTAWRGLQRYRWRKDRPREVQWSYLLVGVVLLGSLYLHGTLGAHLGDEFGIHNTAVYLLRQGGNSDHVLLGQ